MSRLHRHHLRACSALLLTFCGLASNGSAAAFVGVGNLSSPIPGGFVQGLSPEGSTAVGFSRNLAGISEATRWTSTTGLQSLGFEGYADAASSGGTWIVGAREFGIVRQAYRWSEATGRLDLPSLAGNPTDKNQANDISFDGSVIVGKDGDDVRGTIWRSSNGFAAEALTDLQGGLGTSSTFGVSGDATVAVGFSSSPLGQQAVWWDISGVPTVHALGFLGLGGTNSSIAIDASFDGQVIAGSSTNGLGATRAFRWTNADGMVSLGLPSAASVVSSITRGMNADGSVIVGYASDSVASQIEAIIWTPDTGMIFMDDFLATHGLASALTGWTLLDTDTVSDDGLTFAGRGVNPLGKEEGWVATIPEVSSLAHCLFAAIGIGFALFYSRAARQKART